MLLSFTFCTFMFFYVHICIFPYLYNFVLSYSHNLCIFIFSYIVYFHIFIHFLLFMFLIIFILFFTIGVSGYVLLYTWLNAFVWLCVKVGLSPSKNICFIESPLKSIKNAFYFILKALFALKIFTFLSWVFGLVEKTAWLEMAWLTITIHILSNILRSKDNQTRKLR